MSKSTTTRTHSLTFAQRANLTIWFSKEADAIKTKSDPDNAVTATKALGFPVGKNNIRAIRQALFPGEPRQHGNPLINLIRALEERVAKLEGVQGVGAVS